MHPTDPDSAEGVGCSLCTSDLPASTIDGNESGHIVQENLFFFSLLEMYIFFDFLVLILGVIRYCSLGG